MNVTIIGTGYIGLVQGAILADLGLKVTCLDKNQNKIDALNNGEIPIYEPDLDNILQSAKTKGNISFKNLSKSAFKKANIIFIAVGTPAKLDGTSELSYVEEAARTIGKNIDNDCIIITKSTVPVGTNKKIKKIIEKEIKNRNVKINFFIVSNPEFLREGKAVYDFLNPERIVMGIEENLSENNKNFIHNKINTLYSYFINKGVPIIFTNLETAELSKYAANSFLAAKISFINEMALLSEKVNANVEDISKIMGTDSRIAPNFLKAGIGYGGSCFPKDIMAILDIGKENKCDMKIINSVAEVNEDMKKLLINKIASKLKTLKGKTISILGLSFKPETDDIRFAPSLSIIKELIGNGAFVKVYCPKGMENTKKELNHLSDFIEYSENEYECLKNSDSAILITEWKQFEKIDLEKASKLMKQKYFFDFRNFFSKNDNIRNLFSYFPIGRN